MMANNIFINKFKISQKNNRVFVIAEAGVSHFGSLKKAKKLIDLAKDSGADAVKFQSYITEELIHHEYKEWFDRMKQKEMNFNFFKKIKEYSEKKKIIFLCTPHSATAVKWMNKLDIGAIKIGSGEIGNFEFLKSIIRLNKPIIISTGMHEQKDLIRLRNFFISYKFKKVIFLKCNTQYPTPDEDINLKNFKMFKKIFKNFFVGYSDHTDHDLAILGSIMLEAKVIEKHISLDFNVKNAQDWKVSFDRIRLSEMIRKIRKFEKILGSEKLKISTKEKKSRIWASRSIFAKKDIKKGKKLEISDINFLRPGNFLNCSDFAKINKKKLKKNIKANTALKFNDF
jgi:N,N'-diacetyllegionaminate synthase